MAFTIVAVALGLVLGLALGGRPRNVGLRPISWVAVLLAGVGLQVAAEVATVNDDASLVLVLGSYVALTLFALVNLRLVGMPVVLVGLLCNFLVIGANGAMPVRASAVRAADVASSADGLDLGAKRRLAEPGDRFELLSDIVPVPAPVREVLSFGDLILAAGVADVVFRLLRPVGARRREEAELVDADVVVFPPATVRPPRLQRSA